MILRSIAVVALTACASTARPSGPHLLTEAELAAIPSAFPTTYEPPHRPDLAAMHARMIELDNPGRAGLLVSQLVDLRDVRVPMTVRECGESRAYYRYADRTITVCYEFLVEVARLVGKPEAARYVLDQDAAAVLTFVALHEIGHALLHALEVDLSEAENERAADELALLFLTNVGDPALARRLVRAPAAFFYQHGEEQDRDGRSAGDPHDHSKRRTAAAVCILYGRTHDREAAKVMESANTAAECDAYTAEVVTRWNRWLRTRTRISTGNAF